MTWTRRLLRGIAVASLAAVMVGSGFGAGIARAEQGDANYRNVYLGNLAALLNTDWDSLVNNMREASRRTVTQARNNGDISQQDADRMMECINTRSDINYTLCLQAGGLGHIRGREGRDPNRFDPRYAPDDPRYYPRSDPYWYGDDYDYGYDFRGW